MASKRFPGLDAIVRVFSPATQRRAEFRKSWGRAAEADGWLASRLFDLRREGNLRTVDDKTWRDLELAVLFRELDATVTRLGSQYLYNQLRTYEFDADTSAQRYATYRLLVTDAPLREELQLALAELDADSAAYIVDALFGQPPLSLGYPRLLHAWALCCVASIALAVLSSLGLWVLAVILCANAVVLYRISPKLLRDTEALIQGRRLLTVADRLGGVDSRDSISQLAALHAERGKRTRLRKDLRWLALFSDASTLWGGLSVAANWFCLAQLVAYSQAVRRFMESRHEWTSTFELVASMDAAIAVASFLYRTPIHCRATVTTDATIAILDGYHPLISRPVPNSITLTQRSALVTGSNMSGKTTYVKMVGINIILGHTLGFCLASSATVPRSPVMASVRSDQSVESGKSGYSAEVEAIREFVRRAEAGDCQVFVIDEPFNGTNTVERIAVTKAVLDAISVHAHVLATTHDVELQHLLADRFDFVHFREDADVEGFFDFKVRSGTSSERNAIRVLERMGFPSEIVGAALSLVETMPEVGQTSVSRCLRADQVTAITDEAAPPRQTQSNGCFPET